MQFQILPEEYISFNLQTLHLTVIEKWPEHFDKKMEEISVTNLW